MPNQYVEFVRQWSKDHGLSYMCAMGNPNLKSDYKKFKAGEPYGDFEAELNPRKKSTKKREANERFNMMGEDFNVLDFERANSAYENQQMGSEDRNVAIARSKINSLQLINKLKQIKELAAMGSQDRNVGLKISKLIKEIEPVMEDLELKPKQVKKSINKITDPLDALLKKYNSKLEELEKSSSGFKELKEKLLNNLDGVIEKILTKQESSNEELSDILETYIDKLGLIYKKIEKVKQPKAKAKEVPNAKAKEANIEEETNKLIKEKELLKEELKKAQKIKEDFLKKMNAMDDPSFAVGQKYMSLVSDVLLINGKIGKIQDNIYKLNGRYV